MILTQESNGTMSYSGVAFEVLDYFAKAMNIRQCNLKFIH